MERVNLLVSDLDDTLLGDDVALEAFAEWYADARDVFRLVYSSGRFVDSVLRSIEETALPDPDAIIGGVGTQIYETAKARGVSLWPPTPIQWNPYIVESVGSNFDELTMQPTKFQSQHKISFFGDDLDSFFLDRLKLHLQYAGQDTTVIYSSNRDLDILPAGCGKAKAAAYLARRWEIDPERVVVAGNSGNDADMLSSGVRAIAVGNATPDLKTLRLPKLYHASDTYAAGVLEGLAYWMCKSPLHQICNG